jgi:ribose 5-phosphate isomerase B
MSGCHIQKKIYKMKIALACDHGGYDFQKNLTDYLSDKGHEVINCGTNNTESCDYPDYGIKACESVLQGESERAILSCTNGIGMSMLANKHKGIRAALVYSESSAKATRNHHGSNVLCLGAKEFSTETLKKYVDIWLDAGFEGGRHKRRIDKFPE